jgi:hypothetical protein
MSEGTIARPKPDLPPQDLVDVGVHAVADHNHEKLCGCQTWPERCVSGYRRTQWQHGDEAVFLAAVAAGMRARGWLPPQEADLLRTAVQREEVIACDVIAEREEAEDLLDRFAYAIAPAEVIGEHSSGNDPWARALDLVTPAAEVAALRAQAAAAGKVGR